MGKSHPSAYGHEKVEDDDLDEQTDNNHSLAKFFITFRVLRYPQLECLDRLPGRWRRLESPMTKIFATHLIRITVSISVDRRDERPRRSRPVIVALAVWQRTVSAH